jgi:hypothetical protein
MKYLYIVWIEIGIVAVLAACSSHAIRCSGTLRPINKPAVPTAAASPPRAGADNPPAAAKKSTAAATSPDATAGSEAAPAVPRP